MDEITGTDGGTDPFAAAVRATRMPMVISNPRLPDSLPVIVETPDAETMHRQNVWHLRQLASA